MTRVADRMPAPVAATGIRLGLQTSERASLVRGWLGRPDQPQALGPVGIVHWDIRRAGYPARVETGHNLIMAAARDVLARMIAGDGAGQHIASIGFGSGGDDATETDTVLSTDAVIVNVAAHRYDPPPVDGNLYQGPGQVSFLAHLGTADANGLVIQEVGLIGADGVLLARRTRAALTKEADMAISLWWTLIF